MAKQSADRIRELEEQLKHLTGERDSLVEERDEKTGLIERLQMESASKDETIREKDRAVRELTAGKGELDARITAKDGSIKRLEDEIETLKRDQASRAARIEELEHADPEAQARKEIAARNLKEADEAARKKRLNRVIQGWGVGISVVVTLMVMAVIGLVQKNMPPIHLILGIPVVVAVFSLLLPYLKDLIEKMAPHATRNWRYMAHGLLALPLGITFASLGIIESDSSLVVFAVWLGCTLGFGLIFAAIIEMVYVAFFGSKDKKSNFAFNGLIAIVISLLVAVFYRPIGQEWGLAPSYLVNTLLGIMGFSILGLVSMILWFLAGVLRSIVQVVIVWIQDFVKSIKEGKKQKKSIWQKGASLVLTFFSVFVGFLIGAGFALTHGNNGTSFVSIVIGIGAGVGAAAVYFLIEGWALTMVFDPKKGLLRKFLVMVVAFFFATITAYISFGWVYYAASESSRFMETKQNLSGAMNGYLQSTEGSCNILAKSLPDSAEMYVGPVTGMKGAISDLGSAENRKAVEVAYRKFMTVAPSATICMSIDERKREESGQGLLSRVVLHSEPMPADMSAQYWRGSVIQGVSIHKGAATQAIVVVAILDYLLPFFMIFVLVAITALRKKDRLDDASGAIISVISSDDPAVAPTVIVNVGPDSGADVNDGLNVLDEIGTPIGGLKVLESLGGGASRCELTNKFVPEVEQKVVIL